MNSLSFPGLRTLAILASIALTSTSSAKPDPSPTASTIWVTATEQKFNFLQPWEKTAPQRKRGIGTLIEGNRLVIGADLIANTTFIELERPIDGAKTTGKVIARDYEANLAIVVPVENAEEFFKNNTPIEITDNLAVGDNVAIWQLEAEGSPVITSGVINRAEIGRYTVPHRSFLRFNVRIGLENKTGGYSLPVIHGGKLAGVLLTYNSDEQVARVIPGQILSQFLTDLEDGNYQGFPNLGIATVQLTDDQFRHYLGLERSGDGVFVSTIEPGSCADEVGIKVGDVLTSMDGRPIDRRGNYTDEAFGKLGFAHLISSRAVGDKVKIDLIRDGKALQVEATLKHKSPSEYIVDPFLFDRGPNFIMAGGLLFQELTRDYLTSFRDWEKNAPFNLQYVLANPESVLDENDDPSGRKVVFLSYAIPTPATIGYERIRGKIIDKVNGKRITRIEDLASALLTPVDGIHHIEFLDNSADIFIDDQMVQTVNKRMQQSGMSQLQRIER